jgi:hypothetical protein
MYFYYRLIPFSFLVVTFAVFDEDGRFTLGNIFSRLLRSDKRQGEAQDVYQAPPPFRLS